MCNIHMCTCMLCVCELVCGVCVCTVLLQRMHLMRELELTTERKNGFLSEL